MGGKARPVAEEAQAGWSHQQSTSGLLPEGLDDPAEVPWPVHRWICVAFFHHKRGSILQPKQVQHDTVAVHEYTFHSARSV